MPEQLGMNLLSPLALNRDAWLQSMPLEQLRAHLSLYLQQAAEAKHATWRRMEAIRQEARAAERTEMDKLRAEVAPLEQLIEAIRRATLTHHADKVDAIFSEPEPRAMMVF